MTKIDIISGFLGAGKTTFIKKLLQEAISGEQVVLIENEFGEIGIDGGFLKDSGIEIREMNSGCICCSLVGDFGKSLAEVLTTYKPDRIIIEPSGVGKLSDVMKAVIDVSADMDVALNSAVTIVDAAKCKMYMKNFGEFFSNQIEYAGTVILSRTDKASEEKIAAALEIIRGLNQTAAVITTPIEKLSGEKILDTMENNRSLEKELMDEEVCPVCGGHHDHEHHHDHDEHEHHHEHGEGCTCGCHDHDHEHGHHHADDVFTSWGKETPHKFERAKLEEILKQFVEDDKILRSKGMVEGTDGKWIYFDMVPGEYEIRDGEPDYTGRIVVIGTDIHEHELEELFGLA